MAEPANEQSKSASKSNENPYQNPWSFEMLLQRFSFREPTEQDYGKEKKRREYYYKIAKEDGEHFGPDYDDDEENFDDDEIKDPRQAQDKKPKLTRSIPDAADALNNVFEEIIQLPALKKICYDHHVDQEILTKVLENLKNSITQETLLQQAKPAQQLADNEMASPVPLQAKDIPAHKICSHEK